MKSTPKLLLTTYTTTFCVVHASILRLLLFIIVLFAIIFPLARNGYGFYFIFILVLVCIIVAVYNLCRLTCCRPKKYNPRKYDLYYEKHPQAMPRECDPIQYSDGKWRTIAMEGGEGEAGDTITNNTNEKVIRFRGLNLPAKTPSYPQNLKWSRNKSGFYETKATISFVDRPIPLSEAMEHFRRISSWGFNLLRLSVPWEAVCHSGPNEYDAEYLRYLSDLVDEAANFGLYVIIDPHQDVWSRFTGGDGAPWWTLDVVGFKTDDATLHETGCAFLHNQHRDENDDTMMKELPNLIWSTNYSRLATATMFTLFFAGDTYAPGLYVENGLLGDGNVEGLPAAEQMQDSEQQMTYQSYLQHHYLQYLNAIAEVMSSKSNVIGFGTMNEPHSGFVGLQDLNDSLFVAPLGHYLSGFDGMRLGSGERMDNVRWYKGTYVRGKMETLNPNGISAWKDPELDIWKRVGVFDIDESTQERRLLRPNHFEFDGNFVDTYMVPFFEKVRDVLHRHNDNWVIYAEPNVCVRNPVHSDNAPQILDPNHFGWAPHWYDGATLYLKQYSSWSSIDVVTRWPLLSPYMIRRQFQKRLKQVKISGLDKYHTLLGETGIPFDLNDKIAFTTKNYKYPELAMDRVLHCAEVGNVDLDYIIWCYDNNNTHSDGDLWNGEDLSVRSMGRSRGIRAICRPYAYQFSSGLELLKQSFNMVYQTYELVVKCHVSGEGRQVVVLFLPNCHFRVPVVSPKNVDVEWDPAVQKLIWYIPENKVRQFQDEEEKVEEGRDEDKDDEKTKIHRLDLRNPIRKKKGVNDESVISERDTSRVLVAVTTRTPLLGSSH